MSSRITAASRRSVGLRSKAWTSHCRSVPPAPLSLSSTGSVGSSCATDQSWEMVDCLSTSRTCFLSRGSSAHSDVLLDLAGALHAQIEPPTSITGDLEFDWDLLSIRQAEHSGKPSIALKAVAAPKAATAPKATPVATGVPQGVGRKEVLDACADVAFWRSAGLLQKTYGQSSTVDVDTLQGVSASRFASRVQAALSQPLPSTRARGRARVRSLPQNPDLGASALQDVPEGAQASCGGGRKGRRGRRGGQEPDRSGAEVAGAVRRGARFHRSRETAHRLSAEHAAKIMGLEGTSEATHETAGFDLWQEEPKTGECFPEDVSDLVAVWDSLDQLKYRVPDDSLGRVLVPALESGQPPRVANQDLFLRRFHRRTHGLFKTFDWSNVRVIGGMTLSCLVADDAAFASTFAETDVDLYVVGLSGEAFRRRVARAVSELHSAAEAQGLQVSVLRTPCTITLSLRDRQQPLPNVQVICAPFTTTRHMLTTTDIDCTGLALLDGQKLLATQAATQAVATRQNLARPEKYSIRGEFSTESRLLKYATRGFRVLDMGLPPGLDVRVFQDCQLCRLAAEAATLMQQQALGQATEGVGVDTAMAELQRRTKQTATIGAQLLLTAWQLPGLQLLLLYDVPPLPAGMGDRRLLGPAPARATASDDYHFQEKPAVQDEGGEETRTLGPKLKLLEVRGQDRRGTELEEVVFRAVRELDPEKKPEVRSWYTGLEGHCRQLEVSAASE